jgi:hypothetical protein
MSPEVQLQTNGILDNVLANLSKLDVHLTRTTNMTQGVISTRYRDDYVVSVYIISKMKLNIFVDRL